MAKQEKVLPLVIAALLFRQMSTILAAVNNHELFSELDYGNENADETVYKVHQRLCKESQAFRGGCCFALLPLQFFVYP
ncbi:MAG: hypothetical protein WAO19_13060 [Candidatus Kryptoniota bacterium]